MSVNKFIQGDDFAVKSKASAKKPPPKPPIRLRNTNAMPLEMVWLISFAKLPFTQALKCVITCKSWLKVTTSKPYWRERVLYELGGKISDGYIARPDLGLFPRTSLIQKLRKIRPTGADWEGMCKSLIDGLLTDSTQESTSLIPLGLAITTPVSLVGTWRGDILCHNTLGMNYVRLKWPTEEVCHEQRTRGLLTGQLALVNFKNRPTFLTSNRKGILDLWRFNDDASMTLEHSMYFPDREFTAMCTHAASPDRFIVGSSTGDVLIADPDDNSYNAVQKGEGSAVEALATFVHGKEVRLLIAKPKSLYMGSMYGSCGFRLQPKINTPLTKVAFAVGRTIDATTHLIALAHDNQLFRLINREEKLVSLPGRVACLTPHVAVCVGRDQYSIHIASVETAELIRYITLDYPILSLRLPDNRTILAVTKDDTNNQHLAVVTPDYEQLVQTYQIS